MTMRTGQPDMTSPHGSCYRRGAMSEQERRPETDGRDFADAAWSVPSYLLSGILVWGGLGWLLSRWTGVYAFIPIGVIVGVVLAGYLVYWKHCR
ncbi:hypothetical protein GCM10023074_48330 [Microbispora amethystogenes]|uniref:Uncharacterized protein n=2 Tax=Microbispora amethystogenes TaxID=1427754 RepID=A0ABQ4FFR8_9ACTN|nr:hypothetical protein Mam01_38440 [Microbispora amethystogenes]